MERRNKSELSVAEWKKTGTAIKEIYLLKNAKCTNPHSLLLSEGFAVLRGSSPPNSS